MSVLAVSMVIGAALGGGFRSTVGQAMAGIGQMDQGMAGLQRRILDVGQAVGGLYGLKKLVLGSSELSDQLKDAAITAEVTDERMGQLRRTMRQLSAPSETNKSVRDLASAYNELTAAGLSDTLAGDPETLRAIGRTSFGANADMKDLAKTTYTLVNTLGIKPSGLAAAYDQLNYLGKQGAFELKNMSQYFPELAPQMKLMGIVGTEAVVSMGAALQVAKDAAGSQGEAANNMKNFLIKATSPETVKKFAAHGVNIQKVFSDAVAKGENPLEAIIKTTDKLLGNDQVKRKFRLGSLFEDQQAQAFLIAMLADMDKYNSLKAKALKSVGGVDADYARRMDEFKAKSQAASNAIDNLGDSIGRSLLPPLGAMLGVATPAISWLADLSDKAPTTTMAITGVGAAMMILPPALRLVAFGIRGIGLAMAANPIGLLVSGLVVGGALIYDNWVPIKNFFE
ncbi:MAG: phage tail tape measure protein, partial [Magnetospirillum sp.]|nr:phage tail tape measure protein [Magnetospirillum sp.]